MTNLKIKKGALFLAILSVVVVPSNNHAYAKTNENKSFLDKSLSELWNDYMVEPSNTITEALTPYVEDIYSYITDEDKRNEFKEFLIEKKDEWSDSVQSLADDIIEAINDPSKMDELIKKIKEKKDLAKAYLQILKYAVKYKINDAVNNIDAGYINEALSKYGLDEIIDANSIESAANNILDASGLKMEDSPLSNFLDSIMPKKRK